MAKRSLSQQLQYAVCNNMHIGESKRQYKLEHEGRVDGRIYSVQTAENLRATAKSLGKFIHEKHPDIRQVCEIRTEHLQEFIDAKAKGWTVRTAETQISNITAIFDRASYTFKTPMRCNPQDLKAPERAMPVKRVVKMERSDLELLRDSFRNRDAKCQGRTALEISARCGLRIKEIARLETKSINLEKNIIEIRRGGKNGKYRDVPIREQDREYFRQLKESRNGERFVCRGISEDSLNASIRREMKSVGIADKYNCTTNHAVRKMYATERMEELRSQGMEERAAWSIVQVELGHTEKQREILYKTYIKDI